jgi:hypothetical protein
MPQFAIPQYQYQPPLFDNFFSLKYFLKLAQKMQNSELQKLIFGSPLPQSATSPLFCYHFGSLLGSGLADQQTKIEVCPPLLNSSDDNLYVYCLMRYLILLNKSNAT